MSESTPDNIQAQEAVGKAVQLSRQAKTSEALTIFERYLTPLSSGTISDRRVAAAAFSYYGYCVAKVRRKYGDGVKYCDISLRANPLEPDHRANLAMVYLERGDRSKAIEALNAGLRLDRKNKRLKLILESIGRRQPPVVPFLSRDNALNVWLGKRRAVKSPTR